MTFAAYVPCYNNRDSVARAVASLFEQTAPPREVLVVDDGSTDGSPEIAERAGARVVRLGANMGRGAARARAMTELDAEIVVCCDATAALSGDFIEQAGGFFENEKTAAVFGRITQRAGGGAVRRWRGRHLFKMDHSGGAVRVVTVFATFGAAVRSAAVRACGNFNPKLRYGEDAELGNRLISAGWQIVYDPKLEVLCAADNTLFQVLERYWRWNASPEVAFSLRGYLRDMIFCHKVMVARDLRERDFAAACISLLCPHYRAIKSVKEQLARQHRKLEPGTRRT